MILKYLIYETVLPAPDPIDNATLIVKYEYWYKADNSWPEIMQSIIERHHQYENPPYTKSSVYNYGNNKDFSFDKKAALDEHNDAVQKQEQLMWKFPQPLPRARERKKMGHYKQDLLALTYYI